MSSEAEVLFSRRGRAGIITLNRPKALNALTHNMVRRIHPQLQQWERDPDIARVLIEGTGDKAFCAGGDVRALYDLGKAQDPAFLDFYREEYRLNTYIKRYSKPYIALIDGIVMGGGVGVSVHGSHRIAGDNIMFAMPETGIGLFPDVGGTYFLPRCPGEIGMYMGLTGARLNAADALYAGVATHCVPGSGFAELRDRLTEEKDIDHVLGDLVHAPQGGKLPSVRQVIDQCFAAPSIEEIIAKLRGLDGENAAWSMKTADIVGTKSPTSLKISFRQIREGSK
ncbi:MAG: enoyl-CoA hydratase/isomerase family protein, partial [Fimbriimonadaceae bacterium]|nr:enoyl-CoA hydratase/isomerase family protein [Alphaproteobacteria bacterium]